MQGSMVTKTVHGLAVLIITTMVPSRGAMRRELGIEIVLLIFIPSEMRNNPLSLSALKVILRGLTQLSNL